MVTVNVLLDVGPFSQQDVKYGGRKNKYGGENLERRRLGMWVCPTCFVSCMSSTEPSETSKTSETGETSKLSENSENGEAEPYG